jgi:3-dehydroquinate dehydratase II
VRVAVVHGPNLRLLGSREPEIYGATTLEEIDDSLRQLASELSLTLDTFQSNSEGAILDFLEEAAGGVDGFLVNPGGLTHTSVVLRDALAATGRPFVEIHLSNTAAREDFRHHSFLTPIASGVVAGFGPEGYLLALRGLRARLSNRG